MSIKCYYKIDKYKAPVLVSPNYFYYKKEAFHEIAVIFAWAETFLRLLSLHLGYFISTISKYL